MGLVHLLLLMSLQKILIITNRVPYPLKDGGNHAVYSMIEGYQQAGLDVYLLSMNTSRHFVPLEELPELFQNIRFSTVDIDTDVKIFSSLKNFILSKQPNHAERFFDKKFEKKVIDVLEDFEPDVIQLESIYLSVYIPSIRTHSKAKVVARLHNIEYQIWERLAANTSNTFKRFYLKDLASRIKRFEEQAWRQADLLLAITDTDEAVVKATFHDAPVHVVPFGINNEKVYHSLVSEKWVGYHIGAMDWMPNADSISWFLDQVWKEVHKVIPDFEFHFAGRNMPASFKKYEGNGVICAGEVSDARAFIADKKILIVPLQAGSGMRIKVMEAIAAEKLVISTAVGVQGISGLEDGKHFLLAESADDFVRQIKFAFEKKKAAITISKAGADFIKSTYSQEAITKSLLRRLASMNETKAHKLSNSNY